MTKVKQVLAVLVLAFLFGGVAVLFLPHLMPTPDVQAAPAAADVEVQRIAFASIATTTVHPAQTFEGGEDPHTTMDIFWTVTNAANTSVVISLEVSPDGDQWHSHSVSPTLQASITDTTISGYVPAVAVHGVQYRVTTTLGGAETVTPRIFAVLR